MTEKFKRQGLRHLGFRDADPAALRALEDAWDLGYRDAWNASFYARRLLVSPQTPKAA